MKVHELIRVLQCCDKDAEIEATYEDIYSEIIAITKTSERVVLDVSQDGWLTRAMVPEGATKLWKRDEIDWDE